MDLQKNKGKDQDDVKSKLSKIAFKEVIPLNGIPAAYIRRLDASVICDLHLGYEEELAKKGIILNKTQLDELLETLNKMNEIAPTKRLIINGDVRHGFEKINKSQRKEIERFFLNVSSKYHEVILIRGNHDNYVKPIAQELGAQVLDYIFEKELLITHGHKEYEEFARKSIAIVIGHEHPAIMLRDQKGYETKLVSFIYFPTILGNVLVLTPPFSKYATGNLIELNREKFLSVFCKKYAIIEEGVPFVVHRELGTIELPKLALLGL